MKTVRSDNEGKSEWEKWFQFIQTHLNNQLHKSSRFLDSFHDGSFQPRLALFGPGIESPRTKHLVHRMVQAHNSSFNAIDFVAGLPGKIIDKVMKSNRKHIPVYVHHFMLINITLIFKVDSGQE